MTWLLMILQALPQILVVVKAVEDAVGSGNGKAKKDLIMGAIQAGATAGEAIPIKQVAAVSSIIDSVVGTLNKSGVFNRSGVPVVPATPTPAA